MILEFGFHILCGLVACFPLTPVLKVQNKLALQNIRRSTSEYYLDTESPPLVYTQNGWVEGYFQKTMRGRDIAAFEGIPYGLPPTGHRRFRKPEPSSNWEGIRKATKKSPECLQLDVTQGFYVHGNEDCLYLNIFTPFLPTANNKKKGLAVIIYIHGGAYMSGTSKDYGPAYLLDRDIIVVTFNFRLGVLGFAATGDDASSGNWALKDQHLAMQWVSNNIQYFGGDPSKVTLMGLSTGGGFVGIHLVSKKSQGLFQRAVCQSGSSLNYWTVVNETIANTKVIAQGVNCPTTNSYEMMDCLRSKNPNFVVGRASNTYRKWVIAKQTMGPVIEPPSEDAFLVESPETTYRKKDVKPIPLIIGFTKDEGGVFGATMYITPLMLRQFNRNWNKITPYALSYEGKTNDTDEVSKKILDFYNDGQKLRFDNRDGWKKAFGDRIMMQGIHHSMQYHSKIAPTYGYMMSFPAKHSLLNMIGLDTNDWGFSHGDDALLFFNSTRYHSLEFGGSDYKVSEFLINLYTNFADTGVPTYTNEEGQHFKIWSEIKSPSNIELLNVDMNPHMIPMPFLNRLRFWQDLKLKDDAEWLTDS